MTSAIPLYRKTSLPRLKSTSTNATHTILSRLTMLGRLDWPNSETRGGVKPPGPQIAAHGKTEKRIDAQNGTMAWCRIAAFRRPLQVLSIFRHYIADWDVLEVRLNGL